jgi:hypothetical protein
MAKTAANTLVSEVCTRLGWDVSGGTQARIDALKALNDAQRRICMPYSLQFLAKVGSVSVAAGASTAAIPADMDIGKTFTIQKASGGAALNYVPVDQWYDRHNDTYLDYETTRPQAFTLLGSQFHFKPANGTAGALAHAVIYQQTVAPMTDAGGSFSALPEGFEDTILVDNAEAYLLRGLGRPSWRDVFMANREDITAFYAVQRTTKERSMTDTEQQDRAGSNSIRDGVQAP